MRIAKGVVLILVLLELILLQIEFKWFGTSLICFNPCFIGTYSFTNFAYVLFSIASIVLILVLLELILLLDSSVINTRSFYVVLILVLLELILLRLILCTMMYLRMRFNPCFIGTYSFTVSMFNENMNILGCFNPCFIGTYSFTILSLLL